MPSAVVTPLVTFCVVGTNGAEELRSCLDAIALEQRLLERPTEVLVLDNASTDDSVSIAREHPVGARVIALRRREGKAANDSRLLDEARGHYALLLGAGTELRAGATKELVDALERDPEAACAGATVLRPDGVQQPSAWRFPGFGTTLAQALLLHRSLVVQSGAVARGTRKGTGARRERRGSGTGAGDGQARGTRKGTGPRRERRGSGTGAGDGQARGTRKVDWCQSACLLVRVQASATIGHLDPEYFVFGDEVDLQRRLRDAGWHTLFVPAAVCVRHERAVDGDDARQRIVELHRNQNRYLVAHHGPFVAWCCRPVAALPYLLRALAATVLPRHSVRRYWWHVKAILAPRRGEGIREAAERFNAELERPASRTA